MQKCSECGREIDDGLTRCPECGAELSTVASPAPFAVSSRLSRRLWILIAVAGFLIVLLFIRAPGSERFDTIEITGKQDFRMRVVNALTLLKTRSPRAYVIVTNYIGAIKQDETSGMAAYETPPTAYLRSPEWETVTSFASGIAHESIHSRQYHDYLKEHPGMAVPDDIWTGEAAEKQCCEHQMRVLQEIGAPLSEIIHYSWNPSNRYWEVPINKRDW